MKRVKSIVIQWNMLRFEVLHQLLLDTVGYREITIEVGEGVAVPVIKDFVQSLIAKLGMRNRN